MGYKTTRTARPIVHQSNEVKVKLPAGTCRDACKAAPRHQSKVVSLCFRGRIRSFGFRIRVEGVVDDSAPTADSHVGSRV